MFINSINQTINDITTNATNKNTIYRKGDIIDTLTCKTGYTGNGYTLKCNGDDEIIREGDGCIGGCIKYENNTFNSSYTTILSKIDFSLTNTDINTVKEKNKTTAYLPNATVETISCNTSESTYVTNNGGWTIKCNGNNKFIVEGNGCVFKSGSKEFNYTGKIQTFTIPKAFGNKDITLELWGGQGGNTSIASGGKGGYTKLVSQLGNKFNEGTVLYVGVGGRANRKRGGYNGGGSTTGGNDWACGGGGATHIATKNGLLSSLSGSKSSVIAVAGGGGGDSYKVAGGYGGGGNNDGGDGQGVHGGNAYNTAKGTYCSRGVHSNGFCISNSGGVHWAGNNGSFGLGGDEAYGTIYGGGGGGGGYMGGGGASGTTDSKNVSGGAGGSGYCNGSYGSCSGSSGVRSENGYAKITW